MIYFISEDRNSAKYFWINVLETFNKGKYKVIDNAGGVYTIDGKLDDARDLIRKGDTLFIALDCVTDSNISNTVYKVIRSAERICKDIDAVFMYTTYYCFEEMYLSYTELIRMYSNCRGKDADIDSALTYMLNKISAGAFDFNVDKNSVEIGRVIDRFPSAGINREHFDNYLLVTVTRQLEGMFRITKHKDDFGKCWVDNCSSIRKGNEKIKYSCMICEYKCKNMGTVQKLLDIKNNSMLNDM